MSVRRGETLTESGRAPKARFILAPVESDSMFLKIAQRFNAGKPWDKDIKVP